MLKPYHSVADVLRSPWAQPYDHKETTDRVLRSTKLEDSIYSDLRSQDETTIPVLEKECCEKLSSFPSLSRDVFQACYSLLPKRIDESQMSASAKKFSAPILEHIQQSEDFPTLKSICEGRELPAYEAASQFISTTAAELDTLLSDLGGKSGAIQTLERLESAKEKAHSELNDLLAHLKRSSSPNPLLEQKVLEAANKAESKAQQVDAVNKMIDVSATNSHKALSDLVNAAVSAATDKAEEVQSMIAAWSDAPGDMTKTPANTELINWFRNNPDLREITRHLGRFRELLAQGKRNGYTYGRGETYSLELGHDLTRAITSELAMLASPDTLPLFLKKYQAGGLKQYKRRQTVYKGAGDIICCLDESGSTWGDTAAWAKAIAMALLDIAAGNGRNFALIHFSGPGSFKTDVFKPNAYQTENKLRVAKTFLDGGTDFETPLAEAVRLIHDEGFENADIVFITDGECDISESFTDALKDEISLSKFSITGILLDALSPGMDFSIKQFCETIYRTSELTGDEIATNLFMNRI